MPAFGLFVAGAGAVALLAAVAGGLALRRRAAA
jgi:hypothetical protein